jgi:CRP/FNR family transcriptional regulator, cyclic AMP receptor protein
MNSDKKMEERLAAHPFLKGIGMDHIKVLAQSAVLTHFEKDQVIFEAGEPANGFYLIETGTVALEGSVYDHGPITTDVISAGEPLGWSWLFPPHLWHFDARATEPTTAVCFSGILLRQHRDEDPALSHELFRRACEVMVRRLQAARSKLLAAKTPRESAKWRRLPREQTR